VFGLLPELQPAAAGATASALAAMAALANMTT
jgi:hypothetical protein